MPFVITEIIYEKYQLFLSTSILLLFTACNSTNALNHFKKDPSAANAIQHTQKNGFNYIIKR